MLVGLWLAGFGSPTNTESLPRLDLYSHEQELIANHALATSGWILPVTPSSPGSPGAPTGPGLPLSPGSPFSPLAPVAENCKDIVTAKYQFLCLPCVQLSNMRD